MYVGLFAFGTFSCSPAQHSRGHVFSMVHFSAGIVHIVQHCMRSTGDFGPYLPSILCRMCTNNEQLEACTFVPLVLSHTYLDHSGSSGLSGAWVCLRSIQQRWAQPPYHPSHSRVQLSSLQGTVSSSSKMHVQVQNDSRAITVRRNVSTARPSVELPAENHSRHASKRHIWAEAGQQVRLWHAVL